MANRNSTLRVALYARVSTKNNGQDPETQLLTLRDYAKARKLAVFAEYVDIGISGSKDSRPALNRLMADARNAASMRCWWPGSTALRAARATWCWPWRSLMR